MSDDVYIGSELELFADAVRWKSYMRSRMTRFLGRNVLEVGSGIGGTTKVLCQGNHDTWTCLEPDPELAELVRESIERGELPACCRSRAGRLEACAGSTFDTVMYIDVLEHIEADEAELDSAAQLLDPGGHLVVLSPAHQWLYSPFDKAIGHFRRYNRSDYERIAPKSLERTRIEYLDSVGFFASLANRLILKKSQPTRGQIANWDKLMVPLSRVVDPLLARRFGKSILGVWRKPD